jgi:hypothetical protein
VSAWTKMVVALLLVVYGLSQVEITPPPPGPEPTPNALRLDGLFVGETAESDAALLAAMCDEIADEIEWDGKQPEPMLATGVAFDTLRTRARIARIRGESIGDRQPRVRDEVAKFLDIELGEDGGPVDEAKRAAWVTAYRNIAEACRHAIGR